MKTMLIVFFIASLIVLFFVFPFKVRLMNHFNLIEKKGFYSFKFWRINLLCGMIYIDENNKLKIENKNNKIKDRYKESYMKAFLINLIKAINVKKVELFFSGGIKENSFNSAMLCGVARVFVDVVYSFLSQKYKDVKLFEDIKPMFENDKFELTSDFVAEISVAEIIISYVKAKFKNKESL